MAAITKGFHILGKLSRNCDKTAPRNCEARLTWELREGEQGRLEFSAHGEVWNPLHTDIVVGGQCVDTLAALFPRDKRAQRIREVWEKYHLNGMNAGTREQSAALEKGRAELVERMRKEPDAKDLFYHDNSPNWYVIARKLGKASSYDVDCDILREAGLLEVPVTEELRAAALGGLPEGATTYKYGSRWIYYPIPDDVIALIRAGFIVGEETGAPDPSEQGEQDRDLIAELGLTVESTFIPFSQSRNKGNKEPSLNWEVTLKRNGRHVLTALYSAGAAHCPAYKVKDAYEKKRAVSMECETGKVVRVKSFGPTLTDKKIEPNARDVIASLLLDANALDAGTFEEWAREYGYDADSISARAIYDQCVQHALAFRAAVGAQAFDELRAAAQ